MSSVASIPSRGNPFKPRPKPGAVASSAPRKSVTPDAMHSGPGSGKKSNKSAPHGAENKKVEVARTAPSSKPGDTGSLPATQVPGSDDESSSSSDSEDIDMVENEEDSGASSSAAVTEEATSTVNRVTGRSPAASTTVAKRHMRARRTGARMDVPSIQPLMFHRGMKKLLAATGVVRSTGVSQECIRMIGAAIGTELCAGAALYADNAGRRTIKDGDYLSVCNSKMTGTHH